MISQIKEIKEATNLLEASPCSFLQVREWEGKTYLLCR